MEFVPVEILLYQIEKMDNTLDVDNFCKINTRINSVCRINKKYIARNFLKRIGFKVISSNLLKIYKEICKLKLEYIKSIDELLFLFSKLGNKTMCNICLDNEASLSVLVDNTYYINWLLNDRIELYKNDPDIMRQILFPRYVTIIIGNIITIKVIGTMRQVLKKIEKTIHRNFIFLEDVPFIGLTKIDEGVYSLIF